MTEKFTNFGQSTLTASMTNVATTLTVASASTFPSSGNFRVTIDTEIMTVTSISSLTFTVTRGVEGTSAVSHTSGSQIAQVLTSGGLQQTMTDMVLQGAVASLPSAGTAGRSYWTTDSLYVYYDNGSTWDAYYKGQKVKVPATGDFSWLNQGTSTSNNTYGFLSLNIPNGGSGNNLRGIVKATSSSTWTQTVLLKATVNNAGSQHYGCIISPTSGTKYLTFSLQYNSTYTTTGFNLAVFKWDSLTGYNSTYTSIDFCATSEIWMKVTSDATNLYWAWSSDGFNYNQLSSQARTNWLTPANVGIYCDAQNTSFGVPVGLISWTGTGGVS